MENHNGSNANVGPQPQVEISYSCGQQMLTLPAQTQSAVNRISLSCSPGAGITQTSPSPGAPPTPPSTPLMQAIAAAEQATEGFAVAVAAENGTSSPYTVTTIDGGGTNLVRVDPASGRVLGARKGRPTLSKADVDNFGSSVVGLEGAIMAAEKETNGQAIGATAIGGDAPRYKVDVRTNGAVQTVWVDAGTGQVSGHGS